MTARNTYLGDGVYADLENGAIVLTTENGAGPSNTIVLEDEVLRALEQYVAFLRRELADRSAGESFIDTKEKVSP
jgi:hypothetical protein